MEKCQSFFWLLLYDWFNTKTKSKTFYLNCYDFVFCNENSEETSLHLLWDCIFAQAWYFLKNVGLG